jgi:putative surface-exposed virulence protein
MTKKMAYYALPLCIMIALGAAIFFTLPVFAQDEQPVEPVPTEAPVEVVTTETNPLGATPTEAAPTEAPTEVAPTDVPVEPAPVEEASAEAAPDEEASAVEPQVGASSTEETVITQPSLSEVLDDAGVALADSTETLLILPANSSQDLMATGDPYFTVGSITYHFVGSWVAGGCTGVTGYCEVSDTPIMAALDYMAKNNKTPTDRKLYIEPDTHPYNEDVYVDGTWPGVKGLMEIIGKGLEPENVVINGSVYVTGFPSGFSIRNITVNGNPAYSDDAAILTEYNNGALKLTDINTNATGEDGTGIIIFHTGSVELTRVNSSNNDYMGAFIVNFGTGPVTITNSSFDNNAKDVKDGNSTVDCNQWDSDGYCTNSAPNYVGLNIAWAGGPVSLFGVSASGNTGDGVQISAWYSPVTIKSSVFSENEYKHVDTPTEWSWGDGMWIDSKTVTLEKVQANNNGMRGIFSYANASFNGLRLVTDGNGWSGTEVNACLDWNDGDSTCDNPGAGTVTINASGSSRNGGDGYNINSKGVVSMTQFYTGDNGGKGIYVDNTASPATPAVTIMNAETPRNDSGIYLDVKGPVTLKDFRTYENGSDGLHINSTGTGAITITNLSNVFNESRNNGGNGYFIDTRGPVTITNFDTHDNGNLGGYINNLGATSAAAVTINMLGTTDYINGYWGNGQGGLQVISGGAVTISRVMIQDNGGTGAEISNVPASAIAGLPVTISDSSFDRSAFGFDGLKINSKGLITLLNIRANNNGGYGIYLDNKTWGGTAGVTINAATGKGNEFQGNRLTGLAIRTNGPVTATNLYAANNGNNTYRSLSDFTIETYLVFEPDSDYQFSGLVIWQDKDNRIQLGRAYCDNTTGCDGNGLYFDSWLNGSFDPNNFARAMTSPSEVSLRLVRIGTTINAYYSEDGGSTWTFLGNHLIPSSFQVNGVGLTASQDFFNSEPQIASDFDYFFLSDPDFTDNFDGSLENGWFWINENSNYWNLDEHPGFLRIYNSTAQTGGQNLLLRTAGVGYGVDIDAKGAVTIKQVGGWGVQDGWAEGNVFSNNSEEGLNILSNGAVNVAFFQVQNNRPSGGVFIDARNGNGAVTITGMNNNWQNLANNQADGLLIIAKGNITISNIQAFGNGRFGTNLSNSLGTGNVTLNDAWFDNNAVDGLAIVTNGTVTWKNGSANGNNSAGAEIFLLGAGKSLTISNVNASDNHDTGIYVESRGAVTLTEVETNNNSVDNSFIFYGDWWTDNLNPNQVWYFNGLEDDLVSLELFSDRFTPSIWIYAPDGSMVDWIDGSAGEVYYDFYLPMDGKYEVHVGTDNPGCACWGYGFKLYSDSVPEPLGVTKQRLINGIYVDNTGGAGAVSITNTYNRWIANNSGTDVVVLSNGAVTVKGMDLNDSGAGGLLVNNSSVVTGAPGVTLTNVNFYNNNGDSAWIRTKGPVTVMNSDQSGNWGYGFDIDNTIGTALSLITMTNVSLNNEGSVETGVYLRSDGGVTLTNVTSSRNGNNGFDIIATGAVKFTLVGSLENNGYGAIVTTPSTFTIAGSPTGSTWFTNNSGTGLYVVSGGAISLTKVFAGNSGGRDEITGDPITYANGIYLVSTNAAGTSPITLNDVTSTYNTLDGLYIDTNGAVSVNTITTNDNDDRGLYLDQTGAPDSLKPITLNLVTAINNGMDGIYVIARGSITANTFTAHLNHSGSGVLFDNTYGTGSVTVLNTLGNKFNVTVGNGSSGVAIYSKGAVTITQLESLGNTVDGLDVDNSTSSALVKPTVSLSNIINHNNIQAGIFVKSNGVTTIHNSLSTSNGWDGIIIEVNSNVNILNTASINNGYSGIWAKNTSGTWKLTLTGSAWFGNLRDGASPRNKNLFLTDGNWNPVVY